MPEESLSHEQATDRLSSDAGTYDFFRWLGQYIIGLIQEDTVIAITANSDGDQITGDSQFEEILAIINQYALPAAPVR